MQPLDFATILIILGVIAIIVEIVIGAATGFDLLLIGIIAIVGGFIGRFTGSTILPLFAIFALSLFYLFIGRRLIKKSLSIVTKKTNVDNLIGKKVTVLKKIRADRAGQIKAEGEIWRATADNDIDEGRRVVIQSVSGVTVKVKL